MPSRPSSPWHSSLSATAAPMGFSREYPTLPCLENALLTSPIQRSVLLYRHQRRHLGHCQDLRRQTASRELSPEGVLDLAAARREALVGPNRHQVHLLDETQEGSGRLVLAE